MGFEVFARGTPVASSSPRITIQRHGTISINEAAYELLGSPPHVLLLWDSDRGLIAFAGTSEDEPRSYPARRSTLKSGRSNFTVSGRSFIAHTGIAVDRPLKLEPRLEGDLMVVDPNEGGDA